MLATLRKRPAQERRIFAAALFITLAFVILGLWVTSLERTLSSISNPPLASKQPAAAPGSSPAAAGTQADRAPQPPAPLAALKDALSGTIAASRELILELKRTKTPADTAEQPTLPAPPAEAASPPPMADDPTPPPAPITPGTPAANPTPGEIISSARASAPYSSYAAARLLSSPLDPRMVARKPEPEQSRAAAIIFYNLSELRRTAGDVYEYFTR